jgi:hypothetical protein
MQDLKFLDTSLLIEMLAIYTAEYTNMLSHNMKSKAFADCEFNLNRLQAAIRARKGDAKNTQDNNVVEPVPHLKK